MSKFFWSDPPNQVTFPIARAGYPFIAASVFTTAIFAILGLAILALAALAVTFFICYFFRDPNRVTPNSNGAVVAPADGRIVEAGIVDNSAFFEGKCIKTSIFMSLFNVHVNRIPYEGVVKKIDYYPGKFFSADLDKASEQNEKNAIFFDIEEGRKICMVQVAGLIARRIICNVQEGDRVTCGQRFGIICFGSRIDLYLPADTRLNVAVGDRVKAGTSVVGYLA